MSAALLTRPKIVEVCDEVEAFTYVILYYAARYLRSNCDDLTVASFIDDFFDTFSICNGRYVCGPAKCHAVDSGHIGRNLVFDSPMDKVLSRLFSWIKAYYVVEMHKRRQEEKPKRQSCRPPPSPSVPPPSRRCFERNLPSIYTPTSPQLIPKKDRDAPSQKDQELSKNVEDQVYMIRLLSTAIDRSSWYPDDKVGDRVPVNWIDAIWSLKGPVIYSVVPPSTKKPKLDGLPSAPDANGSSMQTSLVPERGPVTAPPRD